MRDCQENKVTQNEDEKIECLFIDVYIDKKIFICEDGVECFL
jgi:hypothetical protein